jgi:phage N-6-adenine-methyltransferase
VSDSRFRHYDDLGAGEEWGTPPDIVTPLAEVLGGFDLDPASGAEPQPYADDRLTIEDDGLATPWYGRVWVNPPYGRKHNPLWADKTLHESTRDDVESITALVPASTGTSWFGGTYATAQTLTFIHQRVSFIDAESVTTGDTDQASFGSVICSFGEFPDDYYDALDSLPYPTTTLVQPRR